MCVTFILVPLGRPPCGRGGLRQRLMFRWRRAVSGTVAYADASLSTTHGPLHRGACVNATCRCQYDWTGPKCLVKRAGAALTCRALEETMIGGGRCWTTSATACGQLHFGGRCDAPRCTPATLLLTENPGGGGGSEAKKSLGT